MKVPEAAEYFDVSRSRIVSPAQACACGEDWSVMSIEEIVSAINGAEDEPRIMAGQSGQLPPAPPGYQYDATYRLVPL